MITCQHCQTWILDGDYRCNRCGRRVRSTPWRNSASSYPITSTATAPAYVFQEETVSKTVGEEERVAEKVKLQPVVVGGSRVIPFHTPTRPAPLKAEKVQVKHARSSGRSGQHRKVEYMGQAEVLTLPQSHIICDAPVAPARLRLEATLIDAAVVSLPYILGAIVFFCIGGKMAFDKHTALFLAMALATVPLLYKLLWAFAGCDTIGMRRVGLQLVDFDGNPPSKTRRYQRVFGSFLSTLAAGIGLIWSLVDEDRLTWHDHISSTFPTLASKE